MKSPLLLWTVLTAELGGELGVDTSHDILTVMRRVEHEGDEFLSITLPTLRKAFERALDEGKWDVHACTSFGVYKGLPRFMGGFLELVFNRDTGIILENPSHDAIRYFRQLTGMFGTILPLGEGDDSVSGCTPVRVKLALEHYLQTEDEVAIASELLGSSEIRMFRKFLDIVFGHILRKLDYQIYVGNLRPRHSGGATADKLKGNQKWTFPEWTERLEEIFPFLDNTLPSHSLASHRLMESGEGLLVRLRTPEEELPVRVIPVPKSVDKPRLISIEPSYMQYMQQAVGRWLMSTMKSDPIITRMIRLDDRDFNRDAAKLGSLDGSLATLDLKDASDRLSWRLVAQGFASYPWLVKAMDATRSRKANVAGTEIELSKFAGMGSALTFPIQTIVFATIALMGVANARNLSSHLIMRSVDQVRVFGDDIIVPSDTRGMVVAELEAFGFKLNTAKSFWTGKFRESCGGDFYSGSDVSYVKVRRHLPQSRNDVKQIVSAVALRNRFYEYGYWRTAAWMDEWLETLLRFYPAVSAQSTLLGHLTFLQPEGARLDKNLQVPVVTGLFLKDRPPKSVIDGVNALTRWFYESPLMADPLDFMFPKVHDVDRFNRSGRPTSATLIRGTRPF